jgi:hypothetical protein
MKGKVYINKHCIKMRALIALMTEAVCASETPVFTETTRRFIPEGSDLHTCRHDNLKSYASLASFITLRKSIHQETGHFCRLTTACVHQF